MSSNKRFTFAALLLTSFLAVSVQAGDSMLPDPKLTPGRVARGDKDRRGVTEEMERHVFSSYRIPWRRRLEFKVDHLIPTELGGADTIDNLWPQSLSTTPYNAQRKELLTKRLLVQIASGEMTLAQAQKEISEDWISCYVDHLGMVYLGQGSRFFEIGGRKMDRHVRPAACFPPPIEQLASNVETG